MEQEQQQFVLTVLFTIVVFLGGMVLGMCC
jgi:hypothetical protein